MEEALFGPFNFRWLWNPNEGVELGQDLRFPAGFPPLNPLPESPREARVQRKLDIPFFPKNICFLKFGFGFFLWRVEWRGITGTAMA